MSKFNPDKLEREYTDLSHEFGNLFYELVEEIRVLNKLKDTERQDAIRYEKIRKLTAQQFSEMWVNCLQTNSNFDNEVDKLPDPWRYSDAASAFYAAEVFCAETPTDAYCAETSNGNNR